MSLTLADPWGPLQRLLEEGCHQGVYTAAVALVGLGGQLRWQAAVGRGSRDPEAPPATLETVFDLASLTKPLATALAVMLLVNRGQVGLNTTLGEVLSGDWLPADKRPLTLYNLLAHRAGLPAWRPFYQEVLAAPVAARAGLLPRLAAATPMELPPETETLYSDLGFMLLQEVVEQVSGLDLNSFCRQEIYRPLGLATLGFKPRQRPGAASLNFAATETGLIPGRDIFGEVHDENAWAAGGVTGHAGLFGKGKEVFLLLAALYRAYQGEATGPLAPELVRLFLTAVPGSTRTLGFDTPSAEAAQCSAGRYFSGNSVGHLGFTGTSFWLDLDLGQMVVLLTNRVHLGRENLDQIRAFRPRLHEAASRALGF